jgi:tetratricopeptide (TPR) repeat protein
MKKTLTLFIVLILGFGGIFAASDFLEQNKPAADERFADEDLYFSARQLNLLGSDFKGLIADWYWINSLQYMGNKVLKHEGEVNINDLRPMNPKLLYPMLETAATLDPQFMTVYSYGAAILPAIDNNQAIKLLEKGISENRDNWRLYHHLGYIYWQAKDYSKAAEVYAEGAKKDGAPVWMKQMSATMRAEGSSRDFARRVYLQMFETAEDEQTKTFAELRFSQIQSLDERDAIGRALQNFAEKNRRCIKSWAEISRELRSLKLPGNTALNFDQTGTPVDPTGVPYVLQNQNGECEVKLSKDSKIPQA